MQEETRMQCDMFSIPVVYGCFKNKLFYIGHK